MNGGYVMIKSTDSEIYSKVKKAIEIGKPILYYENDTTCYYIDSASIVGTDIVLTKGGKTITIDNDNNVLSSGDIQNHLYLMSLNVQLEDSGNLKCNGNFQFYSPILMEFENKSTLTDDEIEFLNKYAINVAIYNKEVGDGTIFSIYNFEEGSCDSLSVDGDNNYNYQLLKLQGNQLF